MFKKIRLPFPLFVLFLAGADSYLARRRATDRYEILQPVYPEGDGYPDRTPVPPGSCRDHGPGCSSFPSRSAILTILADTRIGPRSR